MCVSFPTNTPPNSVTEPPTFPSLRSLHVAHAPKRRRCATETRGGNYVIVRVSLRSNSVRGES